MQTPSEIETEPHQSFLKRHWSTVVEILGVLAALLAFYYEYLWTIPEIHPSEQASLSSPAPFSIENKSNFFAMKRVRITCTTDTLEFSNAISHHATLLGAPTVINDTDSLADQPITIEPDSPYSFPCDALGKFRANDDGTFTFDTFTRPANGFTDHPPFAIALATYRLHIDYRTLFFPRSFDSEPMTWHSSKDGHYWTNGPEGSRVFEATQDLVHLKP
jgi:hypothetical protein